MIKNKIHKGIVIAVGILAVWRLEGQTLEDYGYSTGVDASRWIAVPTAAPSLITSGAGDYGASTVQSLGFTFPFAGSSYSDFSVNTDGNLRLGTTVTGKNNYSSPFSASNANVNNPKINFSAATAMPLRTTM